MTVTYTAEVATSSFSCFLKLLARWRGSIYKLLWTDFILFAGLYYAISFIYRFALNEEQQKTFERLARYAEENNELIPIAFVLAFFVSLVITRWWNQLQNIPWPDRMAMFVTAHVDGDDDRARLMRRTMMRYLCLSYVVTMSSICPAVHKRFPSFQHMADAGFMTPNEKEVMDKINTPHNKYFVPCAWATSLVKRARKEGRIKDDFAVKTLNDEINAYRGNLGTLFLYDWITLPLVYTQVVTWSVYMFFLTCLLGRQFLRDDPVDMGFPLFTFLQYFFYMGWLKVAESLVNPFGEDDDDFDIHSLIDRNLQVSYLIVDDMHNEHPELIRDQYWDTVNFTLPHTLASEPFRIPQPHLGSAMNISMSVKDKEFVEPSEGLETIPESEDSDEHKQLMPHDKHAMQLEMFDSTSNLGQQLHSSSYRSTPDRQTVVDRLANHFPGFSRLMSSSSVRSNASISCRPTSGQGNRQLGESHKMAAARARANRRTRSEESTGGTASGTKAIFDKHNSGVDSDPEIESISSGIQPPSISATGAAVTAQHGDRGDGGSGCRIASSPASLATAHQRRSAYASHPDEEIFTISDFEGEEGDKDLPTAAVDVSKTTDDK